MSSAVALSLHPRASGPRFRAIARTFRVGRLIAAALLAVSVAAITGCGSGGYPGGGITSLSASQVTIDAGQSFSITSTLSGNPNVTWQLSGSSCSGGGCGTTNSTANGSATYTAPASLTSPMQVTLAAGVAGTSNAQTVAITVNPAPVIGGSTPTGTVGMPYTTTLTVTGGTQPEQWSIASGSLPDGLTFNATTGVISGTPTTVQSSTFTVQIVDSSDVPDTVTAQKTIQITTGGAAALAITGAPPNGTVGTAYSAQFSAVGGSAPYTWSITSGALPTGLTLSATTGALTGTPTATGTFGFTVQAQDSTGAIATAAFTVSISGNGSSVTLTFTPPPAGTVGTPYTGSVGVSGGTAPYTCTITGLPPGLTASGCNITGTPTTAGSYPITVTATDSSNPAVTTTGTVTMVIGNGSGNTGSLTLSAPPSATVGTTYTGTVGVAGGTSPYACTITGLPAGFTANNCDITGTGATAGTTTLNVTATDSSNPMLTTTGTVPFTVNAGSGTSVTLTLSAPGNATQGTPYTGVVGVAGGTAPYTCAISGLPAGLTSSSCSISGTPTSAGTAVLSVTATDSSNPTVTTTGTVPLTIDPAAITLVIGSPATATVDVPYTGTVGVTGGTGPYTCAITGLPTGLSANNCTITGTPATAGTVTLGVSATDSSNPKVTTTGSALLVINPGTGSLAVATPPAGNVDTPYSTTLAVSGGTAPYSCVITGLPAGLSSNSCAISGTPTTAGTTTVTVKATDTTQPTAITSTVTVPLVINAATGQLTLSNPAAATEGTAYNGVVGVTGGTSPYNCQIAGLPAGLTANNCAISGTATTSGTFPLTVHATDTTTPTPLTTDGTVSLLVNPPATLTLSGTLQNPVLNVAYSQQLQASGGIQPYTFSLVSGTLPAGLTLASDGTISGTPTAPGASVFTAQVTDTETTPQTATATYTVIVTYPTGPNDGELNGPYAYLFKGYDKLIAGLLADQSAAVGSYTANGQGLITVGEQDENHQATGYSHTSLLGTYEIGADNRGMMALTTLDGTGTPVSTTIYAIAVHAPPTGQTVSTSAQMVESTTGLIVSANGQATALLQSGPYATGISGSYVFGLSGDTPCLISCSVGLSGPAAEVGQFSLSGNTLSGEADANVAATNFPMLTLGGGTQAADGSGRMLTQITAGSTLTVANTYPTDFVTYAVDANNAFLMSTDSHATTILLSGSAQAQAPAAVGNFTTSASLSGPMLGYENTAPNPTLLNATLQGVLNITSATIFRSQASNGTCDITNVDTAGLGGVVSGLSTLLQDVLGTYSSLGNAACTVESNGRATLNYPDPNGLIASVLSLVGLDKPPAPRIAYLSAPNTGYFLETSYAGLGDLVAQTGAPYSVASFDGTFLYASQPSGTAASIDTSGVLTADGQGLVTSSTTDLAIGVGSTLNPLLQLGVTQSDQPYAYAPNAPTGIDPTTIGRFTYGSDVIYEIAPGSFVMIDSNILATAPTITLLY